MAGNTLDMEKVKIVINGRLLKSIMNVQRTDDGEKATYSDPDINGNVTKYNKRNKFATYDITVRNASDDEDLLLDLYRKGKVFSFDYSDKRKAGVTKGGTGNNASIDTHPGNGLEDDPTFTISITDFEMKQ